MKPTKSPYFWLVMIAPLIFLWRIVTGGEILFWGVPLLQFYPWNVLVNQALASGQMPFWTHLLGNGTPLLANLQLAMFYPPSLLFRIAPVEYAMGYYLVLHLVFAAATAYFWGRTLGISPFGSAILALSYSLGGYIVGRTQFLTMVAAYAWLPAMMAFTERMTRKDDHYSVFGLAGSTALQLLAGHAQTSFYSISLVVVYGLWRNWPHGFSESSLKKAGNQLLWIILSLALAVGLAAVQLLPTAELMVRSQRQAGINWDFAMTYSFWPWRLFNLLIPELFGNPADGQYIGYGAFWEDHLYIGILPLFFIAYGFIYWVRQYKQTKDNKNELGLPVTLTTSIVPFFGILFPIVFLIALGKNTVVFPFLFRHVPGFGFFQAPTRIMIMAALGMSTIAGVGAHYFTLGRWSRRYLRLAVAGTINVVFLAFIAPRLITIPPKLNLLPMVYFGLMALASSIILLMKEKIGHWQGRLKAFWFIRQGSIDLWQFAVLILVTIDLFSIGAKLTPAISPQLYREIGLPPGLEVSRFNNGRLYVENETAYNILFRQYFSLATFSDLDLARMRPLVKTLIPDLNAVQGIPSVNNYDPLVPGRWQTLWDRIGKTDWSGRDRILRLLGVKYIMADPMPLLLRRIHGSLYELPSPGPRAIIVHSSETITPEKALQRLFSADFDPHAVVLLEDKGEDKEYAAALQPEAIRNYRETINGLQMDVQLSNDGYVVIFETFYPGWHAQMDGLDAPVQQADYAFMAVAIPQGNHHLELYYRPWSFYIGAAISLFCLGLLLELFRCSSRKSER